MKKCDWGQVEKGSRKENIPDRDEIPRQGKAWFVLKSLKEHNFAFGD